jgi:hypothetical protein
VSSVNQLQHINHAMNRMLHARQSIVHKAVDKAQGALPLEIRPGLLNVQHKAAGLDQQALFNNFNMMGIRFQRFNVRALNH